MGTNASINLHLLNFSYLIMYIYTYVNIAYRIHGSYGFIWDMQQRKRTTLSKLITIPETNSSPPENEWLESFLLGFSRPIFRGYVSFREGMYLTNTFVEKSFPYLLGLTFLGSPSSPSISIPTFP